MTPSPSARLVHLGKLRSLRSLSLTSKRLTDAGLRHLTGLKQLRLLVLDKGRITAAGVRRLRQRLLHCRVFVNGRFR